MFWWFERGGSYLRCEVLQLARDQFELRVVKADGTEQIEQFTDASELARRQHTVVAELAADGWSGPHGWVL
jgi:hypothetical protein